MKLNKTENMKKLLISAVLVLMVSVCFAQGSKVTRAQAEKMMDGYKSANVQQTEAVIFDAKVYSEIIAYPGVVKVASYFGINDEGKRTIILIGVDAKDQLLWATAADFGSLCPPRCP